MRTILNYWNLHLSAFSRFFSSFLLAAGLLMPLHMVAMAEDANKANREMNHLQGVESPYLRQHLYNAVDWYPWGPEALEKAKREKKPIFLSVGYSTCHWCHVMARESFDDEKIGAFLNEHFVSIKVDRERRPDLDEQFMLVTQAITGAGGWPNSVFLTSTGEPFFAGTYFPPDVFTQVLGQVSNLWETERKDVQTEASRIATLVRDYLQRTQSARELTPQIIRDALATTLSQIDDFNGGFGVAPKFPQESLLLALLDQAERDADPKLMKIVTDALDAMIKGGIHDHVGGGFHRYSVDAEWDVPHFEKMLYNQAMIGRLLVRAFLATGEPRYEYTARRTFDYVLRDLRDEKGGFYSAQDAESVRADGTKGEGDYYVWTPEQIADALGDDATFIMNALSVTPDGNFEGASVLRFSELPAINAETQTIPEAQWLAKLNALSEKLRQVRSKRAAPHKDEKIIVAWNAMMIITLAEASVAFDEPLYLTRAQEAADFILNNMRDGNTLNRVSFEGSIGVAAQLPDYAGLGLALTILHDLVEAPEDKKTYLKAATSLAGEIGKKFTERSDKENAPLRMTEKVDGLGAFYPVDDNEIPSGNGLALALFSNLQKRTGAPKMNQAATLLTAALSGQALDSPPSRGFTLKTANAHANGDRALVRNLAGGNVKVRWVKSERRGKLQAHVEVSEGWHINSNAPLEDYFIPTRLSVSDKNVPDDVYPEPLVKALKFNDKELALFEGRLVLEVEIPKVEPGKPIVAKLELQACSDEICLPPEISSHTIWR